MGVYGLILAFVVASYGDWTEVEVGACLTIDEMQRLSHVETTEVYAQEACRRKHMTEGTRYQQFACGIQFDAGQWTRVVEEHKEAGVFFPKPAPCISSVTQANNSYLRYEPLGEISSCSEDEFYLQIQQQENYKTKKYSAGQGYLYLPDPLVITRETSLPIGDEAINFCKVSEIQLEYTGWGKMSGKVSEADCDTGKFSLCKKAGLSVSKNGAGETCLKVERIDDC